MDPALVLTLMLELAVAAVVILFKVERHIASLESAASDPTGLGRFSDGSPAPEAPAT